MPPRILRRLASTLLAAGLISCAAGCPGSVIYSEDSPQRHIHVRVGHEGYVSATGADFGDDQFRPYQTLNGPPDFIFQELHGNDPRIVVETRDRRSYEVVHALGDREALGVVARALGLVVAREDRAIDAITVRERPEGHRLFRAGEGKVAAVERVCCNQDGTWPLDGVTADELALFLERRYQRPVVNLTSLEGRWSILLSAKAGLTWPQSIEEVRPLDDTGLVLRWEKVTLSVTVVKDAPQ